MRWIDSSRYTYIYLDSFERKPEYAAGLLAYCKEEDYTIGGDDICEALTEFNVFA